MQRIFTTCEPQFLPASGHNLVELRASEAVPSRGAAPSVRFFARSPSASRGGLATSVPATWRDERTLVARAPETPYVGRAAVQVALGSNGTLLATLHHVTFYDAAFESIAPSAGPVGGGTEVTVRGQGLVETGRARALVHARLQRAPVGPLGLRAQHRATVGKEWRERAVPARVLNGSALAFVMPPCGAACDGASAAREWSVHVAVGLLGDAPRPVWAAVRRGIFWYRREPTIASVLPSATPVAGGAPLLVRTRGGSAREEPPVLSLHDERHTVVLAGCNATDGDGGGDGTLLRCVAPPWPWPTRAALSASVDGQRFAPTAHRLTYFAPLAPTALSPRAGPTHGGSAVRLLVGGDRAAAARAAASAAAVLLGASAPSTAPLAVRARCRFTAAGGARRGGRAAAAVEGPGTLQTDGAVRCAAPRAAHAGPVEVTAALRPTAPAAAGENATSWSAPLRFDYYEPPSISSIAPSSGPADGGTRVSVRGARFSVADGGVGFSVHAELGASASSDAAPVIEWDGEATVPFPRIAVVAPDELVMVSAALPPQLVRPGAPAVRAGVTFLPNGHDAAGAPFPFTFYTLRLDGVAPAQGPGCGGTRVRVLGGGWPAPGRLDDSRAAVRWTAARGVAACAGAPPRTVEAASVGGDAIETLAPALPRGCGAALEVSLNGQQYEPLGTGGVAYTAVSDCGRGAHAAALVPPRALTSS